MEECFIRTLAKAWWIYQSNGVHPVFVSDDRVRFLVLGETEDDHHVMFEFDDHAVLKYSCDCEYMGKKGIANGALCSHIQAAQIYTAKKRGRVKLL